MSQTSRYRLFVQYPGLVISSQQCSAICGALNLEMCICSLEFQVLNSRPQTRLANLQLEAITCSNVHLPQITRRALGCQVYARGEGAHSHEGIPKAVVEGVMKHAGATGGIDAMNNSLFASDVATWGAKGRSITFAAARFHSCSSRTKTHTDWHVLLP